MTTAEEKSALRAELKDKRKAISDEVRRERDARICERIAQSGAYARADEILLYAARGFEIDLTALDGAARAAGKRVGYPLCDTATHTMKFYITNSRGEMTAGAYGISEPPATRAAESGERTLIILPALAVDESGFRLGFGGGYYDRFLADFRGANGAAVYDEFVLPRIPHDGFDIKANLIFTESGERARK